MIGNGICLLTALPWGFYTMKGNLVSFSGFVSHKSWRENQKKKKPGKQSGKLTPTSAYEFIACLQGSPSACSWLITPGLSQVDKGNKRVSISYNQVEHRKKALETQHN